MITKKRGDGISSTELNYIFSTLERLRQNGYVDNHMNKLLVGGGSSDNQAVVMTITSEENTYLVCDYNGSTVNVAKPWALRYGVQFPTGVTYNYIDATEREATLLSFTETQYVTPYYETDEEIVAIQCATGIQDGDSNDITWIDMNTAGRTWAAEA